MGDGRRKRTRVFSELQSHYLFEDRYGRPGRGNDKGKVEGLVGYARRNFLVPIPSFESFDALNAHLEERCLERLGRQLRGHRETIGRRMERDLEALLPLPATPYDASDKHVSRVSSLSLVRVDKAFPAIVSKARFRRVNRKLRSRAPGGAIPAGWGAPISSAGWSGARRATAPSLARTPRAGSCLLRLPVGDEAWQRGL